MTEDQIKAIAEEFADMYMERNLPAISKEDNIRYTYIGCAKQVLSILSDRYCIVKKEKVMKIHEVCKLYEKDNNLKQYVRGGKNCIYLLFGTQMFNQDEE